MEAMRQRILGLVRDYPGLHLREIARQADTSLNLVQYHVQRLQEAGDVEIALEGGRVHVFPPDMPRAVRGIVGAIRDRKRLRIVMALLHASPRSHGDLAHELRIGKSTLSFQLRNLEGAGIVTAQEGGYGLVDPAQTKTLIDQYRPTPDAADRLADVWRAVYGDD